MAKIPRPRALEVDRATVGVYEYGDPAGAPVIVFHGTPACGAGFTFADDAARERHLRLIAPDRPGVGWSTPAGRWRVGDHPARVAALADVLKIDRFAVWGYSGGAPYAVACAATLGDRVTHAAVSAGMGQMGVWAAASDFEKTDRQFLALAVSHPRRARLVLGLVARLARRFPKTAMRSFLTQLSPADREVLEAARQAPKEAMALFTQAFTHGARGVVDDYAALAQPWGVDVESIRVPMSIWHGDADPMVPLAHAEALHERVPGSTLTVWPGAGHLGTVSHVDDILDALA
jgi:pimeloyl-ACP methyl ester carboxylesterase